MSEVEIVLNSIQKIVDDLRHERDLYRDGLELIAKRDFDDTKMVALLFLGRVVVVNDSQ